MLERTARGERQEERYATLSKSEARLSFDVACLGTRLSHHFELQPLQLGVERLYNAN